MLIKACICGNTGFRSFKSHGLDLNRCPLCGAIHQISPLTDAEYSDFYINDYHGTHQIEIGSEEYSSRYKHDTEIAKQRVKDYSKYMPEHGLTLDFGCANSAFVDYLNSMRENSAVGLDLNYHISNPATTYIGELQEVNFPTDYFSLVTMHDVLEHLVNPKLVLKELWRVIRDGGSLIVDFPDYYAHAGRHHWRHTQHLWFFSLPQMKDLIKECGFECLSVEKPIPSKLVFYCRKLAPNKPRKTVLVLPGMGDIYWVMVKMQDFIKQYELEIPDIYIWNTDQRPRSIDYVERIPFVRAAGYWDHPIIQPEFNSTYMCGGEIWYKDFRHFNYYIAFNGVLRDGHDLEEGRLGELKSNWYFPLFCSLDEAKTSLRIKQKVGEYVVAFFSDLGMFRNWVNCISAETCYDICYRIYKATGKRVILTGCDWDRSFNDAIMQYDKEKILINLVGKTTLEHFLGMLRGASATIGWCGGNTVVSVVLKVPTFIIWSKYFKNPSFYRNALPPDSYEKWYFPFIAEEFNIINYTNMVVKGMLNYGHSG